MYGFFGITLNKGRSTNSGDTHGELAELKPSSDDAQQRPEHKLRRHTARKCDSTLAMSRSTKAGAQTPATHNNKRQYRQFD